MLFRTVTTACPARLASRSTSAARRPCAPVIKPHRSRWFSEQPPRPPPAGVNPPAKSPHAQFYSDLLPAMIPVALVGSAVYIGLTLAREHLSTEKYLDAAQARINELEAEVDRLMKERAQRKDDAPAAVDKKPVVRRWFG